MQIFVLSSISEGMSNTILEAMSTGLALVVSRTGGNPELINDGGSGLMFPPGDPRALADQIGRFADSVELRRAFGEAARQRVVSQFSLPLMIQRYRETYLELAGRRGICRK